MHSSIHPDFAAVVRPSLKRTKSTPLRLASVPLVRNLLNTIRTHKHYDQSARPTVLGRFRRRKGSKPSVVESEDVHSVPETKPALSIEDISAIPVADAFKDLPPAAIANIQEFIAIHHNPALASSLPRARRGSVTSEYSFTSNEEKITLTMRICAALFTLLGMLQSFAWLFATFVGLAPTPKPPTTLPTPSASPVFSETSTLCDSASEDTVVVDIAEPTLPKGPAPVIPPAKKQHKLWLFRKLAGRREQKRLRKQGVVCGEW
ncbi:hypothetical protein HMN09_00941900 [Mycena chlorophos]|uniref:Uncharacterized protein n=1 Tax=Mycena chlorophos TaxID=658473 RepID=A0A8H6SKN8_MYCCL|nr:hypothetical protein HMN09_00941900 [Mycena chlorophos]